MTIYGKLNRPSSEKVESETKTETSRTPHTNKDSSSSNYVFEPDTSQDVKLEGTPEETSEDCEKYPSR